VKPLDLLAVPVDERAALADADVPDPVERSLGNLAWHRALDGTSAPHPVASAASPILTDRGAHVARPCEVRKVGSCGDAVLVDETAENVAALNGGTGGVDGS
jgi:hypothetical protein